VIRRQNPVPSQYGDPSRTPFVRFDSVPIFPENNIHECAAEILRAQVNGEGDPFESFVKRGPIGHQYGILPKSTWAAILRSLFELATKSEGSLPTWRELCWSVLAVMVRRPCSDAWRELRALVLQNLDELSGWKHSFRKTIAERNQIYRGNDGHHYFRDKEGIVVEVIGSGARTLDEERLYFITDQVIRSYGFINQIIQVFALFAISDDYDTNPSDYHRWVKASLPSLHLFGFQLRWTFLHFDYSRSFLWRPRLSFCDPSWLAGDLLGAFTDTLELDFWQKDRGPQAESEWLADGNKYQYDVALETDLRLGPDESTYLNFEGKRFRWINGTPERRPVISMSTDGLDAGRAETAKLNRLLSAIVWHHPIPLRAIFSVGGGRSPHPKTFVGRTMGGLQIDPFYLNYDLRKNLSDDAWFALALFREGLNAGSSFYAYLCYWKILDLILPEKERRREWLMEVGIKHVWDKQHVNAVLAMNEDIEPYLREERLNALKHVGKARQGSSRRAERINPDRPEDSLSMSKDVEMIKEIAQQAIRSLLPAE
jgi:hypothetical protein